MASLHEKLKALRETQGLSQKAMAQSLDIAVSTWNGYEKGKSRPSAQLLKKILQVYNLDLLDFDVEDEKEEAAPLKETGKKEKAAVKEDKQEKALQEEEAEKEVKIAQEEAPLPKEEPKEKAEPVKAKGKMPRELAKRYQAAKPPVKKELPPKKPLEVTIQAMSGAGITMEELIRKVQDVAPTAETIYVKPDENRAYWTKGTSSGVVILWE